MLSILREHQSFRDSVNQTALIKIYNRIRRKKKQSEVGLVKLIAVGTVNRVENTQVKTDLYSISGKEMIPTPHYMLVRRIAN